MSTDEVRLSSFRHALEAALCCPKCGAANRPGVSYIEMEQDGRAACSVCSHSFDLWTTPPRDMTGGRR